MMELLEAIMHLIANVSDTYDAASLAITNCCVALGHSPQTAEAQIAATTGDTNVAEYLQNLAIKNRHSN